MGAFPKNAHCFVQYTSQNCFNSSMQSTKDSRKQGDENAKSNVVREPMKLTLLNILHGFCEIIEK